jgi:glycosyltransferase involved in cell wall biosynthesis
MASRAASPSAAGIRRRPKLVVVSTYPVHPRAFGGQLRSHHVYGALADLCDVEVVSLTEHGQRVQHVRMASGFGETLVPRSAKQAWLEAEGNARSGGFVGDVLAATLTPVYTPAYLDALRGALTGAAAVILAHPYMLPSVRAVAPRLPWVYDAHNVEVRLKRALVSESAQTILAMVAEVEGEATRQASMVFACSDEDRTALAEEYGVDPSRIPLVPNGVDVAGIPYIDAVRRMDNQDRWLRTFRDAGGWAGARRVALFLGSNHAPNVEAVERMLRVVPGLAGVLLVVAGWVGQPFLEGGGSTDSAVFLGPFENDTKLTLLRSAGLGLNPVTSGSGTNLKILEYFAAGLSVVSTPVGARGLEARDGEHLRIVEPDCFADAITETLDAPDGNAAMTRRARHLAERRYAWPVVVEPMRAWVRDAILA